MAQDRDWFQRLGAELDKSMGGHTPPPEIKYRMATPSTQLNCAMGLGLPAGKLIGVIGEPNSGKTACVASWAACVQQWGGKVWWADSETKFDMDLGQKAGLTYNESCWRYDQPDNLEQYQASLEAAIKSVREEQKSELKSKQSPLPAMFVLDSVAMLGIKDLSSKKVTQTKNRPMSASQQWTSFLQREVPKLLSGMHVYLVFLNHLRDNPDTLGYGNKDQFKSPGGRAIKHMEGIRLFVKQVKFNKTNDWFFEEWEKKDSDYGYNMHFYVEKNSFGAPWREAKIPFFFHKGFDDGVGSLQYLRDKGMFDWKGGSLGWTLDGVGYGSLPDLLNRTQQDPDFVKLLQQYCCTVYQSYNTYSRDDFIL